MIHIYKAHGDWVIKGVSMEVKCINDKDLPSYVADGWTTNPDAIKKTEEKPKKTSRSKAVKNEDVE